MEIQRLTLRLRKRKRQRIIGIGFLLMGCAILIDSPYRFPIPIIGLSSVFLALILFLVSGFFLYRGLRLPLDEVLIFVHSQGGEANRQEILDFLDGEEGGGRQLFRVLEAREWLISAEKNLEIVQSREVVEEDLLVLLPEGKHRSETLIKKDRDRCS
jgi:hypothetical protein